MNTNGATIKLSGSKGQYRGEYRGYIVDVALETTAYGDRGWNAYLYRESADGRRSQEGIVTDYPRVARYEAVEAAVATINARMGK